MANAVEFSTLPKGEKLEDVDKNEVKLTHLENLQTCAEVENIGDASDDGVLLGGVEWSSSPVTFHRNKGKSVKLTKSNTVATRTKSFNYGIVFTSEPMIVGQMLKVTVTERVECWSGGMVRAHLVCALFTVLN